MQAKPSLHLISHTHIHTQSNWEVIRVSDRVQAKPFLFVSSSLFLPLPLFVVHRHPEVVRDGDRGPWGPKACRTLTTECWQLVPKAQTLTYTHQAVSVPSSLHGRLSLLFLFLFLLPLFPSMSHFVFPSLPRLLSFLSDLNCWPRQLLQSWMSQSSLSSSLSPRLAAYTGELNDSDRPWSPEGLGGRRVSVLVGWCVGGYMAWRISGSDVLIYQTFRTV